MSFKWCLNTIYVLSFSKERYQMSCIVRNRVWVRANQIVVVVMSVVCEPMMSTAMRHADEVVSMARAVACRSWSRGTKLRGVDKVVSKSRGKSALMMPVVSVHSLPKSRGMMYGIVTYRMPTIGMATSEVRRTNVEKCFRLLMPESLLREAVWKSA